MSLITMNCTHIYTKGINSPQYCKLNNELCIGDCNCNKRVKKYKNDEVLENKDEFINKSLDELVEIIANMKSVTRR
jgi:hypothetical protein